MSREKNRNRRWGMALQTLREESNLTQAQLAKLLGYPKGKGKISEIESGSLPIKEENVRRWVAACQKTMIDFYSAAMKCEPGVDQLQPLVSSEETKKSK